MFDTSTLTPAQVGTLNKHLARLVRDKDGNVVTMRDLYTSGRYTHKRQGTKWNADYTEKSLTYVLWDDSDLGIDVPKLVFEAIQLPDVTERVA